MEVLQGVCASGSFMHQIQLILQYAQGKMAKESEVLLQPGHKWNNIVFYNHTGLKQYPNYMMGGGYLVSGDVAQTLMNVNRKMRLKFTPIEDATMGFWLAAMVSRTFSLQ